MARTKSQKEIKEEPIEKQLWKAADKLRKNIDAAEYKHVVLVDTAGRLHNKSHLMEELAKIMRVAKKKIPEAPHEVLLVLDGTTGQNAVQQAREFTRFVQVTGLVVTKLDGTAKGGIVLSISRELTLPVKYIGVGETIDDLQLFDRALFVEALMGR